MRILFLCQEYPPEVGCGGIGTYVYITAHALAHRGHEVHVLVTARGQHERHYDDQGVVIHCFDQVRLRIPEPLRRRLPLTVERLECAISTYLACRRLAVDFDVIEAPNWCAQGLLFGLLTRAPLVTHVRTSVADLCRLNCRPWTIDARMASWLEGWSVVTSDSITASTRTSVTEGAHRLDPARVTLIPHPMLCDASSNRRAGDAPPCVLFVGRLEPRKNPEVVIRAAPRVLALVPDAQFVFVGRDMDDAGMLASLAEAEGVTHAISLLGWRDNHELEAIRTGARVCVVPSRWESFGFVVTEAMAQGRPVIASRAGGMKDIIRDGETGRLVDVDDPDAWADAIVELLKDPQLASAMGERAREEIRQTYSPEAAARRREAVYREAIAVHRRGRGTRRAH